MPNTDALIVRRIEVADGVIVGKNNMPEFATDGNNTNALFGSTRNPWNPNLTSGGSIGGGEVGLAMGMFALALGTDLGGSLRLPAAFCGVVAIRQTPGLVPFAPDFGFSVGSHGAPQFSNEVGPIRIGYVEDISGGRHRGGYRGGLSHRRRCN